MTEIVLALWSNVRGLFIAAAVLAGTGAVLAGIAWAINAVDASSRYGNDQDRQRADNSRLVTKRLVMVSVVAALLACVPTLEDMWRVRIALVKYDLAAPENVKAATETIERIATKLECKYLGGCEEAKR